MLQFAICPDIHNHLHANSSTGVDDHILPAPRPRRNEGLMNLVVGRHADRGHHSDKTPLQPPPIAQIASPGPLNEASQAIAIAVPQGEEYKYAENSVSQ